MPPGNARPTCVCSANGCISVSIAAAILFETVNVTCDITQFSTGLVPLVCPSQQTVGPQSGAQSLSFWTKIYQQNEKVPNYFDSKHELAHSKAGACCTSMMCPAVPYQPARWYGAATRRESSNAMNSAMLPHCRHKTKYSNPTKTTRPKQELGH